MGRMGGWVGWAGDVPFEAAAERSNHSLLLPNDG